MNNTNSGDTVFDGYTGYGVFRQHAYKYWFLHDEIQIMLTDNEKTKSIIQSLESSKPKIAIIDQHLLTLPPAVLDYLKANYSETPYSELKIRKEYGDIQK